MKTEEEALEMLKVVILIPSTYNDGRKVPQEVFAEFQDKVILLAGGFSRDPGLVEGGWIDGDGVRYRDKSRRYIVAIDEALLPELKDLVVEVGRKLEQKSMYLEIQRDAEIEFLEIQ